ncbi:MAG: peptidoglycan binding domain-containing protein, partial [Tissierellia bacterium]|nr:peptidoglycan binding domain-containing protein [Tissierellia bacterium]
MKKKLSLFLILILILGAIYFGLGYYFSIYTFPNTYFGHQDVSLVKISSLPKYAESRELTIKGRDDHEEIINLKASGLMERADHLYDYQQNPWAWPLEILKEHEIQEEMTRKIDGERLQASLDQLEIMKNPINPQNAHIERKEDGFIISPEREGNLIHKERLYSAIVQAFTKGEYELNLDSEYEEPEIRKEDLEDSLKQLNKIAKANIKLLLPDGTEDQLKPLDYMDENNAVNGDMVQKYVEELKAKYDNIGATRSFTTSGGDRIDISGG